MVDLAKIRKKAKRAATSPAPDNRQPTTDNAAARLEAFLSTAGQKRAGMVEEPAAAKDEIELLTFILGDERYAIDIDTIAEIVSPRPATPVPNAGADIAGVISLRGSIVTVIDIRARLKQPSRTASKESRLIVVRDRGGLLGFEVDRVLRPARIARASIEPQPMIHPAEESHYIRGVTHRENALTIVLDLAKLLE